MTKGIKITIIIVSILSIALVGALLIINLRDFSDVTPTAEKHIKILNETFPSDIMLYGDEILIDEQYKDLKCRKISDVAEKELATSKDFKYSFIVVNDLSGTVELDDAEIDCLKNFITEKHYTLFYLGSRHLETFESRGFCENLDNATIKVKGFCYSGISGTLGSDFENVYSKTFFDENIISEKWLLSNLTEHMVHLRKRVNGE